MCCSIRCLVPASFASADRRFPINKLLLLPPIMLLLLLANRDVWQLVECEVRWRNWQGAGWEAGARCAAASAAAASSPRTCLIKTFHWLPSSIGCACSPAGKMAGSTAGTAAAARTLLAACVLYTACCCCCHCWRNVTCCASLQRTSVDLEL